MNIPSDAKAPKFPVSVKGVIFLGDNIILLKNERDEWELPGGKLEPGEDIEKCLAREIHEELSIPAKVSDLLDAWVYTVFPSVEVVMLTYHCHVDIDAMPKISHEHKEIGFFKLAQLDEIPLPNGYKKAIRDAYHKKRETLGND